MFKVECPGCKAPYQVDERRIPSSGLKMRCPKCGTSFKVDPPGDARRTGPSAVLGGALGLGESAPPPAIAPPDPMKGTMLGVAPQRSAAMKGTMLGVAPAAAAALPTAAPPVAAPPVAAPPVAAPPVAAPPVAAPPVAPPLPTTAAPARPPIPGRPPVPRPGAGVVPPADLPAVSGRPAPGAIDLPSVSAPRAAVPAAPTAAAPAAARSPHLDLDLPAVGRPAGVDLPSPRTAPLGSPRATAPLASPGYPSASNPTGIELDLPDVGIDKAPGVTALPATAAQRGGIDLPSVSRSQPNLPATPGIGLPAPVGVGLPARPAVPRTQSSASFELPSPRGNVDLPSPGGLLDIDLPLSAGELPMPIELALSSRGGDDLPALGGDLPALGGNLPMPGGNLPALGGSLPAVGGSLPALAGSLPALAGSLPALAGSLPAVGGSLPSYGSAGLPQTRGSLPATTSPSLPPALGGMFGGSGVSSPGMPAQSAAMRAPSFGPSAPSAPPAAFSEIELPPSESLPPPQSFGGGFGEVDLLGGIPTAPAALPPNDYEADPFGEAPLPGPMSAATASVPQQRAFAATEAAAIQRQTGGGGTDYGEVSLDGGGGGGGEVALDGPAGGAPGPAATARSEDDMEFGAVPQEAVAGSAAQAQIGGPKAKLAAEKPRRRMGLQLLVGAFVLGLGGAALALVPSVGPFGAFFVMDHLNAGEYHALVGSTAKSANAALAQDSYPDAARAAQIVANAQLNARRAKGLSALAAYVGFVSELRFGTDAPTHARASVLVDELAEETDVDMLDLARAARAAADGQIAKARQLLGSVESSGKTLESSFLRAELELRAKDVKAALAAWEAAKGYGETPRLQYGLARAKLAAGDDAGARADAEAVLAKHPQHVGARVLVARLSSGSRENEARALSLLEGVIKDGKNASADELVQAYTLLGSVHLGRSRISAAESAFSEALKINPKASRALVGLGDSLYRAGRYSEAQARFEAGAAADPDDLLAKVGVAKAKLSLERIQEASTLLKKLREAQPTSPLVGYWYGRVQEALGARDDAQAAYREVLKAAPADPNSADVYIASALLLNQQGRPEDAQKTLDSAKELMPKVPGVWRALGDVAQAQGRYKEALGNFQQAAQLDPDDLGAKFRIGGALRRDGQFEDAIKAFDVVAAIDKDYPGLALERGLLYEAKGDSIIALKQYEDALAKAPTDPDLMLRVGCGKVAANRADQAEELLRKVLSQRPTSAETNHCLGRALLVQGTRLADALRTLERAVELDPNRAEYHLYVGWAANEAGNVPKAEKALAEALRLDQGLADAYWQRGVLRQRQGAVRDAISDLTRALALRPSRHEAHASLADAFYDLGREQEALKEWQLAIQAQPDNPTWRFRYGKLLSANHQSEGAIEQLTRALALIDAVEPPPRWRWEAHHTLARALGPNAEAVKHWEQFLRLGPRDSPYRIEAKAFLDKAGRPWTGD
jgi:predicted Zn finger-like uncharacterized protein